MLKQDGKTTFSFCLGTTFNIMKSACPFCKESIKDAIIAETDDFIAIYNIAPILPGHCMVIPRYHYKSVMEIPADKYSTMMHFARTLTQRLLTVYNVTGFDWSLQEGLEAGQSVPHVHLHIIPRITNDLKSAGAWYTKLQQPIVEGIDIPGRLKLTPLQMDEIVGKLRKEIGVIK